MSLRAWRRACRTAVLLGCLGIPLLNKAGEHALSGNFLSFNFFGLTLADPLAALQVWTVSGSLTQRLALGAGITLFVALILGQVFCAWLCPYGFVSELAQGLVSRRRALPRSGQGAALPFCCKAALTVTGLALASYVALPVLNQLSLPGWYSRALQHVVLYGEFLPGVALFAALPLLEAALGRRLWCRWLCPQSVLPALAGALLPWRLRVRFQPAACRCPAGQRACREQCSLDLDPRAQGLALRLQCSNCGDCVEACRARGAALRWSFCARKKYCLKVRRYEYRAL